MAVAVSVETALSMEKERLEAVSAKMGNERAV